MGGEWGVKLNKTLQATLENLVLLIQPFPQVTFLSETPDVAGPVTELLPALRWKSPTGAFMVGIGQENVEGVYSQHLPNPMLEGKNGLLLFGHFSAHCLLMLLYTNFIKVHKMVLLGNDK